MKKFNSISNPIDYLILTDFITVIFDGHKNFDVTNFKIITATLLKPRTIKLVIC